MAPMYIVVREIKKNKTSAAMKLRAVRTYDVLQSRGSEEIKSRECVSMTMSYKTCSGPHMLKLFNETLVKDYKGLDFPTHMYRLQSFTSLKTVDPTVLVVAINLNTLYAWDQHVEKVMPHFRKDFVEPVIVLIQMGRVKISENFAEVKITSSYDATQLLFNGDSTEFLEFRESLILQQTPIKSITSNSAYSHGNSSGGDLSSSKMRIVGEFWVAAQIIGIESDVNDWFYESCKAQGCNKNAELNKGIVVDVKGTTPFLLWDREALDLVSVKADEVKEMQPKLQLTDNGSYSDEGFFSEEEAKSPNVNAMKEPSVHVTENEAVKRSLLDQFSSTQTSKKKKHVAVKEEKELDDKNMNGCLFCDS
nr:replication protein A 70 kDa DNA-binding subunit D-like [Ipomoea batatas]